MKTSFALNSRMERGKILQCPIIHGIELTNASSGTVGHHRDGKMVFHEYFKDGDWHEIDLCFEDGEGVSGWVLAHKKPFISNDCMNDPQVIQEVQQSLGIVTLVNVPIFDGKGDLLGCLEFYNKKDNSGFSEWDVELLQGLATSTSIALGNAQILKEQKEMRSALQKSEERFILSQHFANIGTWDWDIRSGELYWSDRIAPLFGYEPGKLETTYENFLAAVHDDDRQKVIDAVNACVEEGADYNIEHRVVWPDGAVRWVLERGDVIRDEDNTPLRMLGVVQDITKRVEAEHALLASENQFRGLVESTNDWIWEVDHHGVYTYASPQVEAILGYAPDHFIGKRPFDFMPSAEAERVEGVFDEIVRGQRSFNQLENTNFHASGRKVVLESSGVPFFDQYGNLSGYRGIDRDVTERKELNKQLRLAALLLENTPEGAMITDADLNIIKINPAFTKTTGYSEEDIIGKNPSILSSNRHDDSFYQKMWESIDNTGQWRGEIWNRRKDGEIYPEWLNINTIKDSEGNITHYAAIFSDISTQEHVRKQLHNLAYYDALTGLPNRELFRDRLINAIAQANRHDESVAVIFLDLDRFKNINDTLGHRAGDELLKAVAEVLKACVRDSDTVARLGGDEFTIIIPDVKHEEDAAKVAEKIVNAMEAPFHVEGGHDIYASASIGISLYPADGDDVDMILKNADTAMYRAKEAGRKNYKFYTEDMSARFIERLILENELRRAIEYETLTLAYQPQVKVDTGEITGFEVLARWHHPQKGWIPPIHFITISEETGLIAQIGDWVLQQACAQLKEWHKRFSADLKIAVNLSGRQMLQEEIVDKVISVVNETGIPAHCLELELTETSLMENISSTISKLEMFNHYGIRLAIDDFGTGYSSLSYLKRFQIDKLKIDQSFVSEISTNKNDAEIVTTIIAMANNLHLDVIAEGVETIEQLKYLRENGCNEVQGYYFSQPKSAEAITSMLEAGARIKPGSTG